MKSVILGDGRLCCPIEVCQCFGAYCLLLVGVFLTLKMEAVCSSKTLVNFYQIMRRHIPELLFIIKDAEIQHV
jgi:hypothetical protein